VLGNPFDDSILCDPLTGAGRSGCRDDPHGCGFASPVVPGVVRGISMPLVPAACYVSDIAQTRSRRPARRRGTRRASAPPPPVSGRAAPVQSRSRCSMNGGSARGWTTSTVGSPRNRRAAWRRQTGVLPRSAAERRAWKSQVVVWPRADRMRMTPMALHSGLPRRRPRPDPIILPDLQDDT
jgi:hypothetical protein